MIYDHDDKIISWMIHIIMNRISYKNEFYSIFHSLSNKKRIWFTFYHVSTICNTISLILIKNQQKTFMEYEKFRVVSNKNVPMLIVVTLFFINFLLTRLYDMILQKRHDFGTLLNNVFLIKNYCAKHLRRFEHIYNYPNAWR